MPPLPVKTVANSFLQADFRDGVATISPMKMQKLVYVAHGWNLAINDEPLIAESFEAWPYGPVEEDLYHIFKQYRNNPITDYAKSWAGSEEKAFVVSRKNTAFYEIFDRVKQKYGHFTALQLSALTHQPGTPWSLTRANGLPVIPNDMIRDHFRELAAGGG